MTIWRDIGCISDWRVTGKERVLCLSWKKRITWESFIIAKRAINLLLSIEHHNLMTSGPASTLNSIFMYHIILLRLLMIIGLRLSFNSIFQSTDPIVLITIVLRLIIPHLIYNLKIESMKYILQSTTLIQKKT